MAIKISKGANKFFGGVGKAFKKFGKNIVKDVNTVVNFAEKKALPTIEKVAGQVVKYAPLAMAVAPEFAPVIGAIAVGAKGVQQGAKAGVKLIGTGKKVVKAIKAGDVSTALIEGAKGVQQGQAAYEQGVSTANKAEMMINKPPKNPLKKK